jgi:hypothetical protein
LFPHSFLNYDNIVIFGLQERRALARQVSSLEKQLEQEVFKNKELAETIRHQLGKQASDGN